MVRSIAACTVRCSGSSRRLPTAKRAGLVELDGLVHAHATLRRDRADVAQHVLGVRAAAAQLRLALELAVDDAPVEVEEGQRLEPVGDGLAQHAARATPAVIARPPRPAITV